MKRVKPFHKRPQPVHSTVRRLASQSLELDSIVTLVSVDETFSQVALETENAREEIREL
jgi:hypothetical protein